VLRELIDALEKSDRAERVLAGVWAYIDPYTGKVVGGADALPAHVLKELRDFFKFDDSE
jgi:hypothetical protein